MGETFKQMQDRCIEYGYNEYDRTRLKIFLNDAMLDVFGRYRWSWAEGSTTLSLAAGQSTVSMPSAATTSYITGRIQKWLTPANLMERPKYVDYATEESTWVDEVVDDVGSPTEYSIYGNTIYFNMIAAQAMTFQFTYHVEPTRMSGDNDEPPIPDHFREVLRWGALARQAMRDHDQASFQQFSRLFDTALTQMRVQDSKSHQQTKVAMPEHYLGAYD